MCTLPCAPCPLYPALRTAVMCTEGQR
ncbi:hypothetical protein E2C01_080797 [Portunus trituberculatus]|uniref:Uncharacterized protein n=1 Tax=Portunus trituberculatus TaxID=210409 RepID=A0A5B7IZB0_PORTR|nr:hypothetical protein [Portunus trituberculatus]